MKNKKSLGQHWLKNRFILDEIADLAIAPDVDLCIEIGPGLGTLTSSLLRRFPEVIAIEYDHDLATKLPASFPGTKLRVIEGDFLTTDLAALVGDHPYCIAGNIPYYITSPIVRKILTTIPRPHRVSLLMQKEVAERIAAETGNYNLLALETQNLADVALGPVVPASEFTPPPKVDSQVLALTPLAAPRVDPACLELARRGFSSPRKKLISNLATPQIPREQWRTLLEALHLNPDARAQDLTLDDWLHLYQNHLHQNSEG